MDHSYKSWEISSITLKCKNCDEMHTIDASTPVAVMMDPSADEVDLQIAKMIRNNLLAIVMAIVISIQKRKNRQRIIFPVSRIQQMLDKKFTVLVEALYLINRG